MYPLEKDESLRIHVLRFVLMILVVFIHNYTEGANFVGNSIEVAVPLWLSFIKFIFSNSIARAAVPLFFIISGIFVYSKEVNFGENLRKKTKTILLPYLFWNTLWILFFLCAQSLAVTKAFFPNPDNLIRSFGPKEWLDAYIGFDRGKPLLYPFWFLRDLFILNLFAIPIKRAVDRFPVFTLSSCAILWAARISDSTQSILFFIIGYFIVKDGLRMRQVDRLPWADLCCAYALTIILDYLFFDTVPVIHNICIVVGILFFVKLSKLLVEQRSSRHFLLALTPFTFIIFATHEFLLSTLRKIFIKLLPQSGFVQLLGYIFLPVIVIVFCILLGVFLKRWLPRLYALATGNR